MLLLPEVNPSHVSLSIPQITTWISWTFQANYASLLFPVAGAEVDEKLSLLTLSDTIVPKTTAQTEDVAVAGEKSFSRESTLPTSDALDVIRRDFDTLGSEGVAKGVRVQTLIRLLVAIR